MIYKEPTRSHWNQRDNESPEQAKERTPDVVDDSWIIQNGGREWRLTATRYANRDGSQSRPFWHITEIGDNRREHDADVYFTQSWADDGKPTMVGVNWPAKGTQSIAATLKFKHDLSTAIQTATDAQYIVDQEEAR